MEKRVLIIDDMPQWLKFHASALIGILREKGIEVDITSKLSAKDAYEEVHNNINKPFDLILTDLQMELDYEPEHAGEWLIRNVRLLKQFNNTPIILISASYDIRLIAQKLNVDFLPKNSIVHNPLAFKLKLSEILSR